MVLTIKHRHIIYKKFYNDIWGVSFTRIDCFKKFKKFFKLDLKKNNHFSSFNKKFEINSKFSSKKWNNSKNRYKFSSKKWNDSKNRYKFSFKKWNDLKNKYKFSLQKWNDLKNKYKFSSKKWNDLKSKYKIPFKKWIYLKNKYKLCSNEWDDLKNKYKFCSNEWDYLLNKYKFPFKVWNHLLDQYKFSFKKWDFLLDQYKNVVFSEYCFSDKKKILKNNFKFFFKSKFSKAMKKKLIKKLSFKVAFKDDNVKSLKATLLKDFKKLKYNVEEGLDYKLLNFYWRFFLKLFLKRRSMRDFFKRRYIYTLKAAKAFKKRKTYKEKFLSLRLTRLYFLIFKITNFASYFVNQLKLMAFWIEFLLFIRV